MKLKSLIITFLLSGMLTNVDAQTKYKNNVKAGAFLGSFNLSYERVLNNRSAVVVSPAVGFFSSRGIKYNIGGLGAEYRYYLPLLKKVAADGFYVAPGIGYYFGNASYKFTNGVTNSTNISGTAVKATAGFQHVFKNRLVLDISAGTQYINLIFNGGGIFVNDEAFSGFLPYVGVGVGYSF